MHDDDPAFQALLSEAHALCGDSRFGALLRSHWPELFRMAAPGQGRSALSPRIHPHDQMLLHSLRHHQDAAAAVSQYYNVALQQYHAARQILDALFPVAGSRVELLDFACGFGRLLRFLACCDRELGITASEIQDEALHFVADEFGLPTLASSMEPEAFEPGRRFDVIWVASLFSHLPEGLFRRWLARLHALLTPRGVLCFSVHDEALLPAGEALPATGLLFRPLSENADLDAQAYGTTYVAEAFVRDAVASAIGPSRPVRRIRKALAHEQDIYVVAANAARELSALGAFRRGAWGWVDERRVEGRTLVLRGWAASIDDGPLPFVTVRVGEHHHECPTGGHRPDVGRVFADPRLIDSGWEFRLDLPPGGETPWVEVTATTARGECALLYAGLPGGRGEAAGGSHVYRRDIDLAVRSSLSVLAAMVAPGSRVLDLGTGGGALGRHLSEQRGCRVDGVTLSVAERNAAAAGYERLELLDLEDPAWADRFAGQRYDVAVCADVLEHLREPERVLRACRALLRADGWLLVSVPNVAYAGMIVELMHGDWQYGREGLLDRTHLRFYTRRSFERLLTAEGWRVERVEPIELTWYYTEFWTPFDRLPPAVARYLLAQPDASAYQLVFAARRADAAAAALAAEVPAPDPAIAVAVYASTLFAVGSDSSGAPAQVVPTLGRVGAQAQTLRFALAAGLPADARLRWSPADRPGYLHLQSMKLLDRHRQPRWQWRADRDGEALLRRAPCRQLEIATAAPASPHLHLLLQGDQAQIELPIPSDALAGNGGPWSLEIVCGWPLSADYLALLPAVAGPAEPTAAVPVIATGSRASPPPDADAAVEVVVPVYGSLELVRRCLGSLVDAKPQSAWHLTVIDDASPDPDVGRWLREFAHVHPEVAVVTNARNLGFVATANLGMRLAGRRDVVLLNSDTEVAGDWLDRLKRAAWSGPRVGTATPFSNNATICSYPRFCEANALPAGQTTATLDALFARAHAGQTLGIPTAVGFCMYIRRDCLDEVGEFDAETFGAGYGEENDFCLRASARGWRHVHALDVFVLHAGGASFSDRQQALKATALAAMRRLHPHYEDLVREFIQRDPARCHREAIDQFFKVELAVPADSPDAASPDARTH